MSHRRRIAFLNGVPVVSNGVVAEGVHPGRALRGPIHTLQ